MRTKTIFSITLLVMAFGTMAQDFRSSKEDYLKMARYLAAGSGKWMAPNPNHDASNPRSASAIGLWFDLSNNENVLRLSIVGYRSDTAHIASDALWIWHPGEQKIKYYDMSRGGAFQEGETYFILENDNLFVTRSYTYTPNGEMYFARGENLIVNEKEHKTRSLRWRDGKWEEQGNFTWRLSEEGEGYKVIHRNK